MTKEDEEEYLNYCSEAMFRIHILEQRLNRYCNFTDLTYVLIRSLVITSIIFLHRSIIYRGYYTIARRYESHVQVVRRTISDG